MSRADWLRTFIAVYRNGSVTAGARTRGLSQPAASQQLAELSRAVGGAVFARSARGVTPTVRGRELYAQVAEPLDRLEAVLAGLDGGRIRHAAETLRVATTAELFEGHVLPRLAQMQVRITAVFGDDERVTNLVAVGDADVAITTSPPPRRPHLDTRPLNGSTFALVTASSVAPTTPLTTLAAVADWLSARNWLAYSHELPITRRFWASAFGRSFDARLALVAPDLRAVSAAVELGLGTTLLPTYICARPLAEGRLVRLYDVEDLVPAQEWFAITRHADTANAIITEAVQLLSAA